MTAFAEEIAKDETLAENIMLVGSSLDGTSWDSAVQDLLCTHAVGEDKLSMAKLVFSPAKDFAAEITDAPDGTHQLCNVRGHEF